MTLIERLWSSNPGARRIGIVSLHWLLWSIALVTAFYLRFDGFSPPPADRRFFEALPFATLVLLACRSVVFAAKGLFHGIWRYAGVPELKELILANTFGTLVFALASLTARSIALPRSIYFGEWLAAIMLTGGFRFAMRVFRERSAGTVAPHAKRTLIIGAGDTSESLLRDLQRSESGYGVVALLDDDARKQGAVVRGVRVLGPADAATIKRTTEVMNIEQIILAIPSASGKRLRELVRICRSLNVPTKTITGLPDRLGGGVNAGALREVAIEDLLKRDPVQLDVGQVEHFLTDKVVLVTGAGGSIGSELCRQILRFTPKKVVLFEHDENALFDLERELREVTRVPLVAAIGDITDSERVNAVFVECKPQVVFHAAAHKHVAMMEANPCEAVKNNVFGTKMVAEAAHRHEAEAFVLISTDKAVNPTSVMGATKRVAEMVLQELAKGSSTRFAAVRFGNVLGSAGSVVPIFKEQIRRGGPVRITHPEVTRYFMTIPEASQLVLQAGALGGTGEIFVLDMGQPVKILSLAKDLIELSGLRPEVDIQVQFTGLKPGEKLFEELLYESEVFEKTPHPKILVGKIQSADSAVLLAALKRIEGFARTGKELDARRELAEIVPEATLGKVVPPVPSNTSNLLALESTKSLADDSREHFALAAT
jgi:FlaA1/EpsC-like NDP-sugar epimerase